MSEIQYITHIRTFFSLTYAPYVSIEEMPDCTQSIAFQMQSSFESADFCHSKAKICRNTRLFQRFSTMLWRKCAFQNHNYYYFQKYNLIYIGCHGTMCTVNIYLPTIKEVSI